MNVKYYLIVVLLGIVLTTTSLAPMSTGIYPPVPDYDSFADVSSVRNLGYPDGKIDIADLAFVAIKYGTSGKPQRNVTFVDIVDVNVTNWPDYLLEGNITRQGLSKYLGHYSIPGGTNWYSSSVKLDGYEQYYLHVHATMSGTIEIIPLFNLTGLETPTDPTPANSPFQLVFGPYEVKGPQMRVKIKNPNPNTIGVQVALYAPP